MSATIALARSSYRTRVPVSRGWTFDGAESWVAEALIRLALAPSTREAVDASLSKADEFSDGRGES